MTTKPNRLPRHQISSEDFFQNAFCGMIIIDDSLAILDINETILAQLDLLSENVLGTNIDCICSTKNDFELIRRAIAADTDDGPFTELCFETASQRSMRFMAQIKRMKNALKKTYLITTTSAKHIDKIDKEIVQDQSLNFQQLQALFKLSQLDTSYNEEYVINFALEEAVKFTKSFGGYLHFMHEDQVNLELFTWSSEVKKICTAEKVTHYPIAQAGVWVDCVRKLAPVIHNDYPSLKEKKGYPSGHFPLTRHMCVPIFDNNKIVAVAGVGNKADPYNEMDVVRLQLFVDSMWKILQKRRMTSLLFRYKSILHNAPMLLSFLDTNYTYQLVNKYYCTAFELTEDEILGKQISELFGREAFDNIIKKQIDIALSGKVATYEWCFEFKHFGNKHMSSIYFPYYENNMLTGIVAMSTDITKQKETEKKLTILSNTDPLTSLYNSRYFFEHLNIEIARAKRSRDSLAVLMIDIDDFKKINDNYGHNTGDNVLIYFANLLSKSIRPMDVIARIGGEEVGIILPSTNNKNAAAVARRVINTLNSNNYTEEDIHIKVTASVGIAIYPGQGETGKEVLISADKAMYKAKKNGKNQFAFLE